MKLSLAVAALLAQNASPAKSTSLLVDDEPKTVRSLQERQQTTPQRRRRRRRLFEKENDDEDEPTTTTTATTFTATPTPTTTSQRRHRLEQFRRRLARAAADDEDRFDLNRWRQTVGRNLRLLKNVAAEADTEDSDGSSGSYINDGSFHRDDHPSTALIPCDPAVATDAVSTSSRPDDTGVLSSCGPTHYCMESQDSTTGGVCMPLASPSTTTTTTTTTTATLPSSNNHRRRLEDSESPLFVETIYYFCASDTDYGQICDCDIDYGTQLVDVTCAVAEDCITDVNTCGVNVTDCVSFDFQFNVTGPTEYTRRFCYDFTVPYVQQVCYTADTIDSEFSTCAVQFNGAACNSCFVDSLDEEYCVVIGDIDDPDFNETETTCYNMTFPCYEFDCSNTQLAGLVESGGAGSSCSQDGRPVYEYLDGYGCAENCNICGDSGINLAVTDPTGTVNLTGYEYLYNCGDLDFLGRNGYLTLGECALLQDPITNPTVAPCECEEVEVTTSPTALPVTPRPTPAPVTPVTTPQPTTTTSEVVVPPVAPPPSSGDGSPVFPTTPAPVTPVTTPQPTTTTEVVVPPVAPPPTSGDGSPVFPTVEPPLGPTEATSGALSASLFGSDPWTMSRTVAVGLLATLIMAIMV